MENGFKVVVLSSLHLLNLWAGTDEESRRKSSAG